MQNKKKLTNYEKDLQIAQFRKKQNISQTAVAARGVVLI